MKITIDKNLSTKNKQPEIIDIGEVVTDLNSLLNETSIVCSGDKPVILKFLNNSLFEYALFEIPEYSQELIVGMSLDVNEDNLIKLNSNTIIELEEQQTENSLTVEGSTYTLNLAQWSEWINLNIENVASGFVRYRYKQNLIQISGNVRFSSSNSGLVSIASSISNTENPLAFTISDTTPFAVLAGTNVLTPFEPKTGVLTASSISIFAPSGDAVAANRKPHFFNFIHAY